MNLITSPVQFFRKRISMPCKGLAAVALLAAGAAVGTAAILSIQKTAPLLDVLLSNAPGGGASIGAMALLGGLGGAVSFLVLFAVQAFILCCFYWMSAASGSATRLVEFAGIATFVRVPALVLNVVAISALDPVSVPAMTSESDIDSLLQDYQRFVQSDTLVLIADALDVFCGMCAAGLRGAALYVVAGCSVPWAVAASVIGSLFYVVPWVLSL